MKKEESKSELHMELEMHMGTAAKALRMAWKLCKHNGMEATAKELADTVLDIETAHQQVIMDGKVSLRDREKAGRKNKLVRFLLDADKIFSGENSRELWDKINSLDALSTGDAIRDVLYSFGCAMQRLEVKIDKMNRSDAAQEDK